MGELTKTINPQTRAEYARAEIQKMRLDISGRNKSNDETLAYSVEAGADRSRILNPLAEVINRLFYERNGRK